MALKYQNVEKKAAAESADAAKAAEYKGSWGEIAHEETRCIHFVRDFHGIEERWSYPYETLTRRVFKKSEPEEIEILAGSDTITIRGYGLEKFLEPLEKRQLLRVEQRMMRFAAAHPEGCCVTEIKIETTR
jgi:hypothetical protein